MFRSAGTYNFYGFHKFTQETKLSWNWAEKSTSKILVLDIVFFFFHHSPSSPFSQTKILTNISHYNFCILYFFSLQKKLWNYRKIKLDLNSQNTENS